MTYNVKLKNEETTQWLLKSITHTLTRLRDNPARHSIQMEECLVEILEATDEALKKGSVREVAPRGASNPRSGKVVHANLCKEHPKYQAKRVPRNDCEGCWDAYKTLNPLRYQQARSKFEREKARKA